VSGGPSADGVLFLKQAARDFVRGRLSRGTARRETPVAGRSLRPEERFTGHVPGALSAPAQVWSLQGSGGEFLRNVRIACVSSALVPSGTSDGTGPLSGTRATIVLVRPNATITGFFQRLPPTIAGAPAMPFLACTLNMLAVHIVLRFRVTSWFRAVTWGKRP